MLHILRDLKRAPSIGLYYQPFTHLDIVGYSDADYAGDPLIDDLSMVIVHLLGIIGVMEGKNLVTRFSAEAKYIAMAHATREMVWILSLS